MHKDTIAFFAVIYIPFYALQCARQKRDLEKSAHQKQRLDQLSFESLSSENSRIEESSYRDDLSSDLPNALLDQEGLHVIELNHLAEAAGIQTGMSTSQALARSPELIFYKRNLSNERYLQNTLLQLAYRYSPLLENSAPGICT